ncbi:MAG: disulfide bond formation protein B [bacterium]|nr:disulfide bond formation protein B [bacterium]
MIQVVIRSLATLVLLSQVFLAAVLISFIAEKVFRKKCFGHIKKVFAPHGYHVAFLVSLTATLGSLFFSEVAKFSPCILCWYQRILIYPQTIVLYMAILRKEKVLTPYLYVLNIVGAVIAAYHYFIQIFPKSSFINCEIGGAVSCTKTFTLYYGYITIPLMALTAFILNIFFLSITEDKRKKMVK